MIFAVFWYVNIFFKFSYFLNTSQNKFFNFEFFSAHFQLMETVNGPRYHRAKFTQQEDNKLIRLIELLGTGDWEAISLEMKNRTSRQCKDRWLNYLSPSLSSVPWTEDEDALLEKLHHKYGPRWTKISTYFKNRSPNGVRKQFQLIQKAKGNLSRQSSDSSSEQTEEIQKPPEIHENQDKFINILDTDLFNIDFSLLPENVFNF